MADIQVDELSIKLSSALDASLVNNLKSITDGLSKLQSTLNSFGGGSTSGMTSISNDLKKFSNDISGIDTTQLKDLPKIAKSLDDFARSVSKSSSKMKDVSGFSDMASAISKLGSKNGTAAISNLPQLSGTLKVVMSSFSQLPTLNTDMVSSFADMASAISKIGGKNSQAAVSLLPQFGQAVKQLLNDVATAPPIDPTVAQTIQGLGNLNAQAIKGLIQLSNESEKSAKKVNILTKAFRGIGSAGKGFVSAIGKGVSALKNLKNHATNTGQNGFAQLTKSIVMVRTALWGLRRVASVFTESINLASDLVEVNNVIDHVFGDFTTKIEEVSKASIEHFGISELTFKKTAGQFQAMASTMGITDDMVSNATQKLQEMGKAVDDNGKYAYESNGKMQDMATSITEWVADIASFYDMDYAEAATKAQSIFTGTTRPLTLVA